MSLAFAILAAVLPATQPSTPSSGFDELGNGGDAVVCREGPDGPITSVELLDFFEGRLLRGIDIDLGPADAPLEAKVETAMRRWASVDPKRAEAYREMARTFEANARFVKGVTFKDIDDEGLTFLPKGCNVEQIAVQREPQYPEDRRYLIDATYWDRMDADSRAGLVLHEIIYTDAIRQGHRKSKAVRYLNAVFASKTAESYSTREYFELLKRAAFTRASANGAWVDVVSAHFYGSGRLLSAELVEKEPFVSPWGALDVSGRVWFYEDGSLRQLDLRRGNFVVRRPGRTDFAVDVEAAGRPQTLMFFEDGSVQSGIVGNVFIQASRTYLPGYRLEFDRDGKVVDAFRY